MVVGDGLDCWLLLEVFEVFLLYVLWHVGCLRYLGGGTYVLPNIRYLVVCEVGPRRCIRR